MSTPSAPLHVDGHCYCGAVRFEVVIPEDERPRFSGYCHCDSCRRAHAAPLYHVVILDKRLFRFTAGEDELTTFSKGPGKIERAFCSTCGSRMVNSFPKWRPNGQEVVAFFPNTLDEAVQEDLPEMLRAAGHNCPDECVLETKILASLFEQC